MARSQPNLRRKPWIGLLRWPKSYVRYWKKSFDLATKTEYGSTLSRKVQRKGITYLGNTYAFLLLFFLPVKTSLG